MNIRLGVRNPIAVGMSALAALTVALIPLTSTRTANAAAAPGIYHQTNLVSDLPGVALIQDPDRNALYFASGPDNETHGLFGSLRFVDQP